MNLDGCGADLHEVKGRLAGFPTDGVQRTSEQGLPIDKPVLNLFVSQHNRGKRRGGGGEGGRGEEGRERGREGGRKGGREGRRGGREGGRE